MEKHHTPNKSFIKKGGHTMKKKVMAVALAAATVVSMVGATGVSAATVLSVLS